jgi:hypothetical protein
MPVRTPRPAGPLINYAAAQGAAEPAARLLGAVAAVREEIRATLPAAARAEYDGHVAAVRAALGDEAFLTSWSVGRAMPLDQAIACAMEIAART